MRQVDFFPPYFVAEMRRRVDERDHSTAFALDTFLEQLAATAVKDSNHAQLWLHRCVSAWRQELLASELFGDQPAEHEYIVLLWLWQLCEFVRTVDVAAGGDTADLCSIRLQDFELEIERQMERYQRDFEQIGWMCLLIEVEQLQNTRMSGISTSSKLSLLWWRQPNFLSVHYSVPNGRAGQTSKSRKKRFGSGSVLSHVTTFDAFKAQLAFLNGLLHSTFVYPFQFEMLVRLIRPAEERVWTDVLAEQYRMNKPRAYAPKKKGGGVGAKGSETGGTSAEVTPAVSATSTPRPDTPGALSTDSTAAAAAEPVLPQFILPLSDAAEAQSEELWAELFPGSIALSEKSTDGVD